jgi:hypothetical protein
MSARGASEKKRSPRAAIALEAQKHLESSRPLEAGPFLHGARLGVAYSDVLAVLMAGTKWLKSVLSHQARSALFAVKSPTRAVEDFAASVEDPGAARLAEFVLRLLEQSGTMASLPMIQARLLHLRIQTLEQEMTRVRDDLESPSTKAMLKRWGKRQHVVPAMAWAFERWYSELTVSARAKGLPASDEPYTPAELGKAAVADCLLAMGLTAQPRKRVIGRVKKSLKRVRELSNELLEMLKAESASSGIVDRLMMFYDVMMEDPRIAAEGPYASREEIRALFERLYAPRARPGGGEKDDE